MLIMNLDLILKLILGTTDTTGTGLMDMDTGAVLTTVATTIITTERERQSLSIITMPEMAQTPRLIPGMDTMVIMVMDTVPMDMDTMDTVLTDILTGVR